jgi:hypothetical protein
LGPVNVLALEEYKEAEQRQEFLETQQSDLRDSIRHASDPRDRRGVISNSRGVRGRQRQLPQDLPDALRRRPRGDALDR